MSSLSTLLSPIRWTLLLIATIAFLAVGTLGIRSWIDARNANAQLSATIATQKQLLDQATAREQQRDAAVAKTVATIKQAKAAVKTPQEAAAQIPQVLPPLPVPVQLKLPQPDLSEPTPAASATVPQADLQPIYNYIQDCRACQAQLAAAQSDLADERTKESALTTERDAAIKAVHKGGFWSHLKSSAKWLLIGAAAGALITEATHQIHT